MQDGDNVQNTDQEILREVFFSHATNFQKHHRKHGFVYYTNADTAVKIIRNQELWMRKASLMNDYAEIQHGFDKMKEYLKSVDGKFFLEQTDLVFPGVFKQVWQKLYEDRLQTVESTYLLCISKHFRGERKLGRLSMWRAYGGNSGVALVLNSNVFHQEKGSVFNIIATEVFYDKGYECKEDFKNIAKKIVKKVQQLKQAGKDDFAKTARRLFLYYAIALKHPAFVEEQEVRVFWHPDFCEAIPKDYQSIETIAGIPQKIIKIPLREKVFSRYGLNNLLSRVLIGPTEYPQTLRDSFLEIMRSKEIKKAENRITVTNIPLRPNR